MEILKRYKCYDKDDMNRALRINRQYRTRNNAFKLEKILLRKECEVTNYLIEEIDEWNGLSNHHSAESNGNMKRRLDKIMNEDIRWK